MINFDRRALFGVTLYASAVVGSVAFAEAPADRWAVEVSTGKCRLQRTLSSPIAARITIETDVGTDEYSLSVEEGGLEQVQVGLPEDANLTVDGRVQSHAFVTVFQGNESFPRLANIAGVPVDVVDAMGSGREFSIDGDAVKVGPLPLPDAPQAFAALRRCEAQQLIEWGADPAQFMTGGSRPRVGDRMDLISQSELRRILPSGPGELLHYLEVDATGTVVRCAAVFGATDASFERDLCASVLGRKVGSPARDSKARPVRGVISFNPALIQTTEVITP